MAFLESPKVRVELRTTNYLAEDLAVTEVLINDTVVGQSYEVLTDQIVLMARLAEYLCAKVTCTYYEENGEGESDG